MVYNKGGMAKFFIIAAVLVALIVVGTSAFYFQGMGGERTDKQFEGDKDLKESVMGYIKKNHPDAAVFIDEPSKMVWSQTSSTLLLGYSKYVYTSDGWTVTIGYTITAEGYVYQVRAENKNEGITWVGTVRGETVSETSYTH